MRYLLLFIFVGSLSLKATAQANKNIQFTFNHVSLSVKDVNAAAEFYSEVLNLQEIVNRTKIDGVRWFSLNEEKELHLIAIIKTPITINKAVHFALTTPDFDAFIERLQQLKVAYGDWPGTPNKITIRADGIKQIYFQDPDGYWIELNSVAVK
ncbi:VOC family protein [Ferruginibacter yonginensis]|uniref:VOC family protein n=1 Tax=Ferruginibacter yonginensis TaxID=1310416 RepID=A0ABV8QVL2_9BACT